MTHSVDSNQENMLPYLDEFLDEIIPKHVIPNQDVTLEVQKEIQLLNNQLAVLKKININDNSENGETLVLNSRLSYSPKCSISSDCSTPSSPLSIPMSPVSNDEAKFYPIFATDANLVKLPKIENKFNMCKEAQDWVITQNYDKEYQYDPKPLTSKNCRRVVPDAEKTDQYWVRRNRNNKAARKSREFRRQKEMEVLCSMKLLEGENLKLRHFINSVVKSNQQLQNEVIRLRQQVTGPGTFFIANQP